MDGTGSDAGPAADVVGEIAAAGRLGAGRHERRVHRRRRAGGGRRGASRTSDGSTSSSTTPASSAGPAFPEADEDNLTRHLAVHTVGSFNTARAAWPHMADQGYGRIVMTTSSGVFGLPNNISYATAKAAVIGLTRSLAAGGVGHGIRVEPHRTGGHDAHGRGRRRYPRPWSPELVAPMVAYLAHEDCPVTGEIYAAGAGRFARIFIAPTPGYVHPGQDPTVEDVADALGGRSTTRPATRSRPTSWAWSATFLAHLQPRGRCRPSRLSSATGYSSSRSGSSATMTS